MMTSTFSAMSKDIANNFVPPHVLRKVDQCPHISCAQIRNIQIKVSTRVGEDLVHQGLQVRTQKWSRPWKSKLMIVLRSHSSACWN